VDSIFISGLPFPTSRIGLGTRAIASCSGDHCYQGGRAMKAAACS
jgi:hypothetical protein